MKDFVLESLKTFSDKIVFRYFKEQDLIVIESGDITEQEIRDKASVLEAAEPMRLLRLERDRRIALTDWRFRSDLTPRQEWYEYCQALRDLPSTAEPMLDENGNLTNVTWPEEPVE